MTATASLPRAAEITAAQVERACQVFYGPVWFSERDTEFARNRPRLRQAMRRALAAVCGGEAQ